MISIMKMRLYTPPPRLYENTEPNMQRFGAARFRTAEPYDFSFQRIEYGEYPNYNGYSISYEGEKERTLVEATYKDRLETIDAYHIGWELWHASTTWIPEAWETYVTDDYWDSFVPLAIMAKYRIQILKQRRFVNRKSKASKSVALRKASHLLRDKKR